MTGELGRDFRGKLKNCVVYASELPIIEYCLHKFLSCNKSTVTIMIGKQGGKILFGSGLGLLVGNIIFEVTNPKAAVQEQEPDITPNDILKALSKL